MEHFKRSTARDFRINGATLEAALREESSDEEEDDEHSADEQDEVNLNQRILVTYQTRGKLGRVDFRKDFWDCYEGQGGNWPILGTLRTYDRDVNGNVKKAIGLMSKATKNVFLGKFHCHPGTTTT